MAYIINGMRVLLERGEQLPTLPTVVFQLHQVLEDEHAGPGDVAAIIERDPALTTRLLRAANSAAFSRGGDRIGSGKEHDGDCCCRRLRYWSGIDTTCCNNYRNFASYKIARHFT